MACPKLRVKQERSSMGGKARNWSGCDPKRNISPPSTARVFPASVPTKQTSPQCCECRPFTNDASRCSFYTGPPWAHLAQTMEPTSYGTCSTVFRVLTIVLLTKFCFAPFMPPQLPPGSLRVKPVEFIPVRKIRVYGFFRLR